MKKEFVCISCPVGCRLTVWEDEDGAVQVQGNTCPRGKAYGVQEFTAPMRTVTSSVPVQHGEQLMCSVKTDAPVPKARIPEVLAAIQRPAPHARLRKKRPVGNPRGGALGTAPAPPNCLCAAQRGRRRASADEATAANSSFAASKGRYIRQKVHTTNQGLTAWFSTRVITKYP